MKRHKELLSRGEIGRKGNPLRQNAGDFHARVYRFLSHGIVQQERQRGREIRKKRKRMRRIDYERRQRGRNTGLEVTARFFLLSSGQFVPPPQETSMLGELRNNRLAVAVRLAAQH